jgi:hypothetical protein
MPAKNHFDKLEAATRREAMSTSRKVGNYRLDPWQVSEARALRPSNCHSCCWSWNSTDQKFHLKFQHLTCYPAHARD